jgi:hypothetical protein
MVSKRRKTVAGHEMERWRGERKRKGSSAPAVSAAAGVVIIPSFGSLEGLDVVYFFAICCDWIGCFVEHFCSECLFESEASSSCVLAKLPWQLISDMQKNDRLFICASAAA